MVLADDLALALDPSLLMAIAGTPADPWQADVLRSDAKRQLLLCSRQSGKSTVTAAMALHTAIYQAPALVLLLSPSLRQSGELFRKVSALYGYHEGAAASDASTLLRLELRNGSRIISLPGTEATIRGYSGVGLLVIDEAARVPDDLYRSVRPMLAVSGGRLICLSTPFGKRGWFHQEWTDGGPGWQRTLVKATDCPRISAAFLEEERAALGNLWFEAEYFCEFTNNDSALFSYDDVMQALDAAVLPLFGGI
jgi:hypothetical protein